MLAALTGGGDEIRGRCSGHHDVSYIPRGGKSGEKSRDDVRRHILREGHTEHRRRVHGHADKATESVGEDQPHTTMKQPQPSKLGCGAQNVCAVNVDCADRRAIMTKQASKIVTISTTANKLPGTPVSERLADMAGNTIEAAAAVAAEVSAAASVATESFTVRKEISRTIRRERTRSQLQARAAELGIDLRFE